MAEFSEPEIQESNKPKVEDVSYDLNQALSSVVSIRTKIPEDAFTAQILGTERAGNGVVINESGLILTIGYLISEAETVWLMGGDGRVSPGHIVAYDQETGFGLVQALEDMGLPALPIGSSSDVQVGESVVVAGYGGREHACKAQIVAKREFAGYWEYVLDEAIFTAPAHPSWGGAALIDSGGRLAGIGSLFVQLPRGEDKPLDGNMIVPIDILVPIMNQLLKFGKVDRPPRPWLGMYTAEAEDELVVVGMAEDGPAYEAGVEIGDRVLEVDGEPVITLVDMFRRIWRTGDAGVQVPLTVWRDETPISLGIPSIDRSSLLKKPRLH